MRWEFLRFLAVTSAVAIVVLATPTGAHEAHPLGEEPPSSTTAPTVTGMAAYPEVLMAQGGVWQGTRPMTTSFQWQRCSYDDYPPTIVLGEARSYWQLGQAAGEPAYDTMGELDGTFIGGVTYGLAGALVENADAAVSFDGATGYVDLPSVQFDSGDFTIEGWFKITPPLTPSRLWSSGYSGGSQEVKLGVSASGISFRASDASGAAVNITNAANYSDTAWHQVAVTRAASVFTLYVDGAQVGSATSALGDVDAVGAPTRLSASVPPAPSEFFRGLLDEVSVSGRAVSSVEVAARHAKALGADCAAIPGATASSYTIQLADADKVLRVVEMATNIAGSASAPSSKTLRVTADDITYQQLALTGMELPPTPAEAGLPPCNRDPDWPGYSTIQELRTAVAAAADESCVDDPAGYTYSVRRLDHSHGGPPPAYRWMGPETLTRFQGGMFFAEVSDPDVDHTPPPGTSEHMAARVAAKFRAGSNIWLEAGWIEYPFGPSRPRIYAYSRPRGILTHVPNLPPLGQPMAFKVAACSYGSCAYYFWDGEWIRFGHNNKMLRCAPPYRPQNCFIEVFLEAQQSTGRWPGENAPTDGPGVNFYDTWVRLPGPVWDLWDTTYLTQTQVRSGTPYVVCMESRFHAFQAGKQIGCPGT